MEQSKKTFQSPKARAIIYTVCCMVVILLFVALSNGNAAVSHIGILAGGLLALICYHTEVPDDHLRTRFHNIDWEIPAGFFLLNWSVTNLTSHLFGTVAAMFSQVSDASGSKPTESLLGALGAVIIAPVGEELIFRQCGTGLLKRCAGKPLTFLLPSVLFAVMHMAYNVQGLSQMLAGALLYAFCFYVTDNVLYTIIVHAAHNLMCDFMLTETYSQNGYTLLQPVSVITNLVLLAAGAAWFVLRFYPRYIKPLTLSENGENM